MNPINLLYVSLGKYCSARAYPVPTMKPTRLKSEGGLNCEEFYLTLMGNEATTEQKETLQVPLFRTRLTAIRGKVTVNMTYSQVPQTPFQSQPDSSTLCSGCFVRMILGIKASTRLGI